MSPPPAAPPSDVDVAVDVVETVAVEFDDVLDRLELELELEVVLLPVRVVFVVVLVHAATFPVGFIAAVS